MFNFWLRKNRPGDPERFFKIDHLQQDLKRRSVRGGAVTLMSQGGRFVLQMVSTAVLARLLTPADYGLIGMTAVVTGFIQLFQDIGLSAATVQSPNINHKQSSTLFWINISLGLGLAVLTILVSPAVAKFYDEPLVNNVMRALSINFFISGLGGQHLALLQRQMKFKATSLIVVLAMSIGVAAAIITALINPSYWALVIFMIAQTTTKTVGAWMASGWRPGLPDMKSGVGEMLKFGGNVTGFNTVNYFSRNLDNILIGRVWGSGALGLYTKAYQILLLPITQINAPITTVALPVLSRLKDNPEQYKRYYFKAISLITAISMPLICFLFSTTDQVISILLGERWLDAAPIFQFLTPAALVGTFNVAGGWAYQSLGRTSRQFQSGIITSFINTLIFFVSVHWGVIALAAAYGLTRPPMAIFTITYCYWGTFLKWNDLIKSLYRQLIASIAASTLTIIVLSTLVSIDSNIVELAIGAAIFLPTLLLTWMILPGGKKHLIGMTTTLKEIKK